MASWKKFITVFFITLMVLPTVSDVVFADNLTAVSGGVTTNSCPAGQQPDASGIGCIPTPISNSTITTPSTTPTTTKAIPQPFNPNVNITSGNTYGGASISGVGGAIASCFNVGGFLVSQASNLLSGVNLGSTINKSVSSFLGGEAPVATNDKAAISALDKQNQTTQCLDGIAYAVAKNALAQITNKTLNWVNTGFNGNPLYVQNVNSYLGTIKNTQITSFLSTVQKSDPIFGNALRSAITQQIIGKTDGLLNTPLNTPQAQAYNSFQTDFTNGGWNALLNPAYNPIGAFFNAVDTLNTNVGTQQQQATNEIQRNNGFLDMKQCVKYADTSTTGTGAAQCSAITSDSIYENCCTGQAGDDSGVCNDYAKSYIAQVDPTNPQCASISDDTEYNNCCDNTTNDSPICIAYNTSSASDANSPSLLTQITTSAQKVNGYLSASTPVCTQYATTTPGSVIASQVQTVTNTPVQQLVYANKINEVLGGFFDSFVNKLLSKGLRGTNNGIAVTTDGGEGNNTVTNDVGTANTADLGYQASNAGDADTGDFDISRPQQLRAILQTQENFLNATQDAQIAVERIVPAVGALDYCIPGPNPDWSNGLSANWSAFESAIQQAPPNAPSTLASIAGALPVVGGLFSVFFSNSKPPALWTSNPVLNDKATGGNLQINRTFYDPHNGDETTTNLEDALQSAYNAVTKQIAVYTTSQNTFDPQYNNSNPVGNAFVAASANDSDPVYVHGFLQDAYAATDSLVGYNQAATTIDTQYSQNISSTENTIEQMQDILNQVDTIVSQAKASYIKNNPGVNLACLNKAYVIDTTTPTATTLRTEPSSQYIEEDAMVQHSIQSASYFYNNEAN